jgi:hypothetical protein
MDACVHTLFVVNCLGKIFGPPEHLQAQAENIMEALNLA